jgi:hypothetical protein
MPLIQLTHSMYIAARICRSYGASIAQLCLFYKHFAPNGANWLRQRPITLIEPLSYLPAPNPPIFVVAPLRDFWQHHC